MKRILSPLLLLLTAVIWGFAFVAQKSADTVPAFTMTAFRSGIAAVFLLVVMPLLDRVRHTGRHMFLRKETGRLRPDMTKKEWLGGAVCGVVLFVATSVQQYGIMIGSDAGKSAFISALYVVHVPILGLFLGRRPPAKIWASVALAVIGFYFLCVSASFGVNPDDLFVLLSSLAFAAHVLVIGRFSPFCDGVRMSCVQFVVSFILSAACMLLFESFPTASLISENLLEILFVGIGSSGIAYTCQILGQKNTPPAVASVILSLESVFGAIGAALVLHETMTPRETFGCVIVFLAVFLAQFDFVGLIRRLRHRAAETPDK